MTQILLIIALVIMACLAGCGSGEDDQAEDSRICIVNDSFNDNSSVVEQAQAEGLEVEEEEEDEDSEPEPEPTFDLSEGVLRNISFCGDPVVIDAIVESGEPVDLAEFLESGRRVE